MNVIEELKHSLRTLAKVIALVAIVLGSACRAEAQQQMLLTPLAANTVSNLLATPAVIDAFSVINATTNNATLNFYDSSNTSTTMVQAAYTSYTAYATNYTVVWTNSANTLVTNTFSGIYTAPVAHTASTNTRPLVLTLLVPASSVLNKDVNLLVGRGLNAVANQALTLSTTWRRP